MTEHRTKIATASILTTVVLALFLMWSVEAQASSTCANRMLEDGSRIVEREIAVVCEVNQFRRSRQLDPLTIDNRLSKAAENHLQAMIKAMGDQGKVVLNVNNAGGVSLEERARTQGYPDPSLSWTFADWQETPSSTVSSWTSDADIRRLLLWPGFGDVGVTVDGVASLLVLSGDRHSPEGTTGLEPRYQGNAGRDPGGFLKVLSNDFRAYFYTASKARVTVTATRRNDHARKSRSRRGTGWVKLPVGIGYWRLCWKLVPGGNYTGASRCVGMFRHPGDSGVRVRKSGARKLRVRAGKAVGRSLYIGVFKQRRMCGSPFPGVWSCTKPWIRIRKLFVPVKNGPVSNFRVPRGPTKLILNVKRFDLNGLPYRDYWGELKFP